MEPPVALAFATVCGLVALFGVSYLMKLMHRLKSDGTARIERAVGLNGTVYLTIPAGKQGAGKVTLNLQNRLVEYQAVTATGPLPTGSSIVVTAVVGPDTVEVAPAPQPGV
ncbi:MAG: NfeD family protein [Planctomycetia bacterium]|nr:NfeD family protein [Planctomycetia bacterium]